MISVLKEQNVAEWGTAAESQGVWDGVKHCALQAESFSSIAANDVECF